MEKRDGATRSVPAGSGASGYDASSADLIERYWQDFWEKEGTFHAPNPSGSLRDDRADLLRRPKFYLLDMFPYPSGAGLHVGHPLGYIGTDVLGRYLRMAGYNVLHSFGYDSFGLPAEQYAIETGTHPSVTTEHNIVNMRRQLRRLGLAHDGRRELVTSNPDFYRWTQWIFLQMFNSWYDERVGRARPISELAEAMQSGSMQPISPVNPGGLPWSALSAADRRRVVDSYRLAYVEEAPVNWCPGLGTVLANEEVTPDGRSDIGNYPVFRRAMRQWMLRITAYAERLLDDLAELEWPDSIKAMQRNWIGRSEGAVIRFRVADRSAEIPVFTTRPDTLAGATYVVLSPEHPLVEDLLADEWGPDVPSSWMSADADAVAPSSTPALAVTGYRETVADAWGKVRAGAQGAVKRGVFIGSHAVNPLTGRRLPVFIGEHILMTYGTGAVMGVPAHDQRDFDFGRSRDLPARAVLMPPDNWFTERHVEVSDVVEDWREAYEGEGQYLRTEDGGRQLVDLDQAQAVDSVVEWLESSGHGEKSRSYRLRDWLFSRQRYWGEPFPIVYGEDDLPIAIPEEMLPVELPPMVDFRPQPQREGDDTQPVPPLARATDWVTTELDLDGTRRRYRREVNTMPQWAGSCWYYLRYLDPANSDRFVAVDVERYWMGQSTAPADGGVDLYVGGVEQAVLHLLYARFMHKILYDLGHVHTPEPFRRLYNQGYILADAFTDARGMYVPAAEVVRTAEGYTYHDSPVTRHYGKMGKSLKNSVAPDDIYAQYGADTLRLYEMSMGPFDMDRPWSTEGLVGPYRFLQRLWRNIIDEEGETSVGEQPADEAARDSMNSAIAAVWADIEALKFNTAVARLFQLNNVATTVRRTTGSCPRELAECLLLLTAPFAPHIAEELWRRLGHEDSIAYAAPPVAGETRKRTATLLPVQIDRRVRFEVEVEDPTDVDGVRASVLQHPRLGQYIAGRTVAEVIVVPGRIVSLRFGKRPPG